MNMTDSMFELNNILKDHARRYRLMQPTDAVKLLYQNEFGGGHLITDPEACLEYLRREFSQVTHDDTVPTWEDIGNGIIRVNLAGIQEADLPRLGLIFIRSSQIHHGSMAQFHEKLQLLRELTQHSHLPFSIQQLDAYLKEYADAGFPAVSHSHSYRQAYHPAYRVVCKDLW